MRGTLFADAPDGFPRSRGDAFAVVDARGTVTNWTPGAERMLGWAAAEARGPVSRLLWSRADGARLAGLVCPEHSVFLGPLLLRHREGTPVGVVLWGHPLAPDQWLLQAENAEAVRNDDLLGALLHGLFTESPFIIDVFDTDLCFLARNDSQIRATGFPDDFVGRTMREVSPPGLLDTDAFEARQRLVLTSGRAMIGSEVHGRDPRDPDRDTVWSETILPLRGADGDVVALAHMVFDLTTEARARERLDLVNEASARIGSTLDVLHTAQELTDVAVPRFADFSYVNLLDTVLGGEEPLPGPVAETVPLRRAAATMVPDGPARTVVSPGEVDRFASTPGTPAARALATGKPVLLTGEELLVELEAADPARAQLIRGFSVRSWLLVPMFARGAALGVVLFVRFSRAHSFEADDVLLAQEFVARAAVCIDNASRYTRERATAMTLQRNLLPQRLPVLTTVETASRHLPRGGHAGLGGSWFDVIPLSGARTALVIGEAGGRGLHSAVSMGRLRTAVRTLADLDMAPEELLTHLSDQVKRFQDEQGGPTPGATAPTCLYAIFDPTTMRSVMASAGHAMPARLSPDGEVSVGGTPATPPLGTGGVPFECAEMAHTDGDLLALYTYGLLAPESGGGAVVRLGEALAGAGASAGSEPGEVADETLRRLVPGGQPGEEVSLLVARLHRLPPDRYATWDLPDAPESVGRARGLVTRKLTEWDLAELEFTTELLVSELVTNAIRYGSPPVRLRLIRDRRLICEVGDGSSTSPHVRRALETDEGGRGLYLVSQLASLWGTRYHARGKTLWAEQPLPAPDGTPDDA
ncbi:SpoIIE family protein phosphatase [Actinacidiphila glaucinigra]|uniref:ATP-binding SpoIIE family protein phosphatase n=1 Tax=Actinacidiphila glaucinigra TaxID=235986 RepID=UPI003824C22C